MFAHRNGDAAVGSIAHWNLRKSSMWRFGAAEISNAGGPTRFSGIAARNALEFLKCIRGQTIGPRKIDNEKAPSSAKIGATFLSDFRRVWLTKISTSQSILIACASKKR